MEEKRWGGVGELFDVGETSRDGCWREPRESLRAHRAGEWSFAVTRTGRAGGSNAIVGGGAGMECEWEWRMENGAGSWELGLSWLEGLEQEGAGGGVLG